MSERIAAAQVLASLEQQLLQELQAEGVDVAAAAGVEDDSSIPDGEVAETGFVDEAGELRRPWCPATRILEHREMVRGSHACISISSNSTGSMMAKDASTAAVTCGQLLLLCTAVRTTSSSTHPMPCMRHVVLQQPYRYYAHPSPSAAPAAAAAARADTILLQEKANREAETARSAAQKDPLAQPAPPPKLEVCAATYS